MWEKERGRRRKGRGDEKKQAENAAVRDSYGIIFISGLFRYYVMIHGSRGICFRIYVLNDIYIHAAESLQ